MRRKRGVAALTLVVALIAVPAQWSTPARADSGYASTLAPFQVSLGHDTGTLTLATTTFVPSVGVVAAPNPSVDWGDGTSSEAAVPALGTCVQCDLQGSHLYTAAGHYTITITYYTGCCISYDTSTSVDVITPTDRFVIAAIGDSAASGEGNPDQPIQYVGLVPEGPPIWSDGTGTFGSDRGTSKCHRSQYAPGAEAAQRVQQENIYTFIDFTLLACSGAYIGIPIAQEIAAGNDLTANDTAIKQVTHLPPGHIDALLIMVGANNLDNGYSNLIETCLEDNALDELGNYRPPCEQDTTLTSRVASDLAGLAQHYDDLAAAIQARGDIGKVFITEYFDPTHNAEGTYGDDASNFACTGGSMTAASWQWSHDDVVVPLNNAVASAAAAHGWQFVGGIASQFLNHGFCAWTEGQNWVVALDSLFVQGDINGTAHANHFGQAVYRDALTTAIYNGTPPTTTASAGAYTFGDVTTQAVQVTLSAHNALAKAGVGTTYYAIDNPACTPSATANCLVASGPFTLSDNGKHMVSFFSQNSHGTSESLKTVAVDIAYVTSLTWPAPQPITYGTALDQTQLDASANATTLSGTSVGVPGTFAYSADGSPLTSNAVLPAGSHTLTVQFTPNDTTRYTTPAAVSVSLTVKQAPLTITASSPSMIYNDTVPAITPSYSGFVNNESASSFTTPPTCSSTAPSSGTAGTYPTSCTGAVDHNYSVGYVPGTLTISKAASTVSLSSSAPSALFGQPVTFTATISVNSPGAGNPSGTVKFKDGTTDIGCAAQPVSTTTETATCTTSALSVASHSITAIYGGDANFSGSGTASALTQTVNMAATSTTLRSSVNPSTSGQPVTFTATVAVTAPGAGAPTGAVTFKDGSTTLGTGSLSTSNGVTTATFTTNSLAVGTHSITAGYGGDGNFVTSAGVALTQYVNTNLTSYPKLSNGAYNLSNANLSGDYFVGVSLAGASLANSNLTNAVFIGADSTGANLSNSNFMSSANFTNAILKNANLSNSNLKGATFSGANLSGANFTNSNLTGATGLKTATLTGVMWSKTACPDGTNSSQDGGTCVDHL